MYFWGPEKHEKIEKSQISCPFPKEFLYFADSRKHYKTLVYLQKPPKHTIFSSKIQIYEARVL